MDDITVKIQSKKSKIDKIMFDLSNEILTCVKFLIRLKNHSMEIVRNLESSATAAVYLEEFVTVNSFLLKYLSLLTEINCKFEMLEISEKRYNKLALDSDKISTSELMSIVTDIFDSKPNSCKSAGNIECSEDSKTSQRDNFEKPMDSSVLNFKESDANDFQKNKFEKFDNMQCSIQDLENAIFECNLSSYMDESAKSLNDRVSNPVLVEESKSSCSSRKLPDLEVLATQIIGNGESENEKFQEETLMSGSHFLASANSVPCSEVWTQQSKIHLANIDIPIAEVVPTKINESNSFVESEKDVDCLQGTSDKNLKMPQPKEHVRDSDLSEEDDIKPFNILRRVGDEYEISIENIQSPSEFYVYIKNGQLDLFLELVEKLKVVCNYKNKVWNKKNGSKKDWLSQQLGSYVLFYSKCDEMWCRAKVINWYMNYKDDFVRIFLLDFGEYKCVSVDDLDSMPECLKEYPAFTRRCHLYGILPPDVPPGTKTLSWGKESIERMQSLTETSKHLKIRIAPEDEFHPASSLPVLIWLSDQNDECVNELLVIHKCAVFGSHFDPRIMADEKTENDGLNNWNPMREDFEAYENSYDLKIHDPATYIYGYVGQDYDRICKHYNKTGYCFKGKACTKEHKKLDRLGFTTDQEEVYKNAFNSLALPAMNTMVPVQVTCLLDINNFFCILKDQNQLPEEENLQSLLVFMNKAENIKEMKKLLIPPSAGQIVIARYSEDLSWYRAKILESLPEKDIFSVLFVDYGNKEAVPLSHIRAIEARYLHLPFQALQCFIYGIEANPKASAKDAMSYLDSRIIGEELNIEIVSRLPGEDITLLVHVFDKNGRNIGVDLIAKNYAVPKKEMLISSDSRSMPG